MSKPRPKERLTPIPKRTKRDVAASVRTSQEGGALPSSSPSSTQPSPPAAPDLSMIAEQLRPLAVLVGDVKFDPLNARTHDEGNLEAIRGSLAVYGQRKPIVVNRRTNEIEAGNGTLQAALSLGWSHVAAVYVDDDPATASGFAVADNRSAELAGWDKGRLAELMKDLNTGNDHRLDKMMADLAVQEKIAPADPDPDAGAGTDPAAGQGDGQQQTIKTKCPGCGFEFGVVTAPEADVGKTDVVPTQSGEKMNTQDE